MHSLPLLAVVEGEDFNIPDSILQVVFNSGSSEGVSNCTMVNIVDDDALEGDHNFSIRIQSTSPGPLNIQREAHEETLITIKDNDSNNVFYKFGILVKV